MRNALVAALLLAACGKSDKARPDDADARTDTGGYNVVSPTNETLALLDLEDPEGNAAEVLTIADQLLVGLAPGATTDEIDALVDTIASERPNWGLRVIGRVPSSKMTQLAVDNLDRPASEQAALLREVIARFEAESIVSAAVPNHLLEMSALVEDYSDDNNILQYQDRCAYSMVDYFQAYALLRTILQNVPLHDVTVAVVDTEIDRTIGEFDEIAPRLTEISSARPVRSSWAGHGTAVAGIIAADNGDGAVNGVALPFLGNRLSMQFLFVDPVTYDEISAIAPGAAAAEDIALAPLGNVLAAVDQAVAGGSDVVNLSFGSVRGDGAPPVHIRGMRQLWWDHITHADARNTLFVAAAPNHPIELTGQNTAPAGLTDPATGATPDNLLTVGGLDGCDPMQRWSSSARGDLVQAYAPALNVQVLDPRRGNVSVARSGNSFAAPFVTSIAAIVRAVAPSTLDGAGLRNLLLADPASLPMSTGGADVRPSLMFSVGHAVLQYVDNPSVDALLDSLGGAADNVPDPTGWVANQRVMEGHLTVTGPNYSSGHTLGPSDVVARGMEHFNYGVIDTLSMSLNLKSGEESMGVQIRHPLQLNQPYAIGRNVNDAAIALRAGAPAAKYLGAGTSGTVTLRECELTTRSLPLDHAGSVESGPYDSGVYLQLSGVLSGTALGYVDTDPVQEDVTYQFSGDFNTTLQLIFPPSAEMARWEQICEGGFTQ